MIAVHRLMGQIVGSLWLSRAVQVPRLRIRAAGPFPVVPKGAFDLPAPSLLPLLPARLSRPGPSLQLIQRFFLIRVQPLPVRPRLLCYFHQVLRGRGCVYLHVGGIRRRQPPACQALLDALLHHFLKQPPEHLPERRLPSAKLRDGAVIRDPLQRIQSQIPPQGHIGLDALLELPLRRDAVQVSYQHHRVDRRPAMPTAV